MRFEFHYRWQYFDPVTRRWQRTEQHCSEQAIRLLHEHVEPVWGTQIMRQIPESPDDIAANPTARSAGKSRE